MNIIICSRNQASSCTIAFNAWWHFTLAFIFLASLMGTLVYSGYYLGTRYFSTMQPVGWANQADQQAQNREQELLQQTHQANLDALTMRLGELQAHVVRLDALGVRLVKAADLDADEFDFKSKPALGGPGDLTSTESDSTGDLLGRINYLSDLLEQREQQLSILDDVIQTVNLSQEIYPSGRPITKGWISSYYGMRSDPFSGKPAFHKGMDFAAKEGSDVVAVAGGVVTYAGKRYGYGNMVEVTHDAKYSTRYGHNNEVFVRKGDTVNKGDVIAAVGNSGRSTGPHVHFEVLKNGKHVDPEKYIRHKTAKK